jgi:RNA polymerase sigma-70 factor (ECF subfamily)
MEPDPRAADTGGVGLSANAFAEIYGQHMPELTRYCRSILRDREDAEDAAQSAMERALKALSCGPAPERMRPWLFTIAQREAITLLRRRRPVVVLEDEAAATASIEELSAVRERLAELMADLQALAPRQREVLVARELGGRSYREIAAELGTTEAAAQQVVLEARQSLRQFAAGRSLECDDVQSWISAHDHARVRTRRVRAHLRACTSCRGFQTGIGARRRDFGLLLPGIGGGGAWWSALAALLGEGGAAKAVTAGAVVLTGATLAGTLPESHGPVRAPAPRVASAPPAVVVPVSVPVATAAAVALRARRPTAAGGSAERRRSERRAASRRRDRSSAQALLPSATPQPARAAEAGEPAPSVSHPHPTAAPAASPAATPAATPDATPAPSLLDPVQPVLDAVPTVTHAVEEITDVVKETLPPIRLP